MEEGQGLTAGHTSHSVLVLLWLSGMKLSHREKIGLKGTGYNSQWPQAPFG